ncbi:DEAD/DEAH box helicase [Bailinhaonella thermotolerans]|uniref:DEAD/DEAH box helicase n=1 Tax=Bailinhaonella thermotolerans TaxID=1070861 RepID=A0A3A4AUT3_9ACTN|nr:DEAD/DEAH box helicase [Bailinhaonella thermotolerans]RJL23282.1 DEAD/DEAH box helicase [Bailinhaonella thermotolerans]
MPTRTTSRPARAGRGRTAPAPDAAPTHAGIDLDQRAADVPQARDFADLGVPEPLRAALAGMGIHTPFPIQAASIGDALAGRDVLGRGRTGSGKTVAFTVPLTAVLARGDRAAPNHPRGLILVPTRELATQVHATLRPLAEAVGLTCATVFGGVSQQPQAAALNRGVDVLVACPGRLEDLIGQGLCDLDAVRVTVLDEADHMADLGFLPAVRRLLDRTPRGSQRLLFSATLDNGIGVLVRRYMHDPAVHSVDSADSPVAAMTHHVFVIGGRDKDAIVRELAAGRDRRILFTRTKHGAKKLARALRRDGLPAVELHGNLSQPQRKKNLDAFGEGTATILVATDIAARGIHVDDVGLVVHVDPPAEHKAYLHRSGRTARAGAEGVVVTLATGDQHGEVKTLMRKAGIKPLTAAVRPGEEIVATIRGEAAVRLTPPPAAPARPAPQRSAPQRSAPQQAASERARAGAPPRRRGRRGGPRKPAGQS